MRLEQWIYTIPLRLRALFRRNRLDSELDEEIRDHLDRQIEFNLARGINPEEARLLALRKLGNAALLRDQTRATWNWNGLEQFMHDLRIGIRTLSRTPGFTQVASTRDGAGHRSQCCFVYGCPQCIAQAASVQRPRTARTDL